MDLLSIILNINRIVSHGTYQDHKEPGFARYIRGINTKINTDLSISIDDIAEISKHIVINQIFTDGNHRTAVALCYYLSTYVNNCCLRIKPYLLYASVDFEYFKSAHFYEDRETEILKGNAIGIAIQSRSITPFYPTARAHKDKHYAEIIADIKKIAHQINKIKTSQSPSITTQRKLFLAFAGGRPECSHSSSTSESFYRLHIKKKGYIDKPFSQLIIKPVIPMRMKKNELLSKVDTRTKELSCVAEMPPILPSQTTQRKKTESPGGHSRFWRDFSPPNTSASTDESSEITASIDIKITGKTPDVL